MIIKVNDQQKKKVFRWFNSAKESAIHNSSCPRGRGGSVIVKNEKIIGFGWNSPPQNIKLSHCFKDDIKECLRSSGIPVEKLGKGKLPTCCIHTEVKAIFNAIEFHFYDQYYTNLDEFFEGTRIYYVKIDKEGNIIPSGKSYCTDCAKLVLDIGISEWCLWHENGVWEHGEGVYIYDAKTYYEVSFNYHTNYSTKHFDCISL